MKLCNAKGFYTAIKCANLSIFTAYITLKCGETLKQSIINRSISFSASTESKTDDTDGFRLPSSLSTSGSSDGTLTGFIWNIRQ